MTITEILKHGRENAIRADVLAARLETTPRGLRRQIMQAREQGETILYSPGGHGGYFLPSDDPETAQQEMSAFYHVQVARCNHGLAAIAPVARKLGIPIGQLNFDEADNVGQPQTQAARPAILADRPKGREISKRQAAPLCITVRRPAAIRKISRTCPRRTNAVHNDVARSKRAGSF